MQVDFDEYIDRSNSDCYKWGRYRGRDLNPHWVADMDFKAPEQVVAALHERVAHAVYGYADPSPEHAEVIQDYLKRRYDWAIAPEAIVWLPGLVCGFNAACRSLATRGDGIISMLPIYPPFRTAPRNFEQQLITVEMLDTDSGWEIDFDAFEQACQQASCFMLCNPHNPVGRIYTRAELERLVEICLRHDVAISSDEIHCDLILDTDKQHIPTACISPEIAQQCMTFMAPSKTYNLPGLACCFAIIENPKLRTAFRRARAGIMPDPNILGMHAALVAYRDCDDWLQQLLSYLRTNRDLLEAEVAQWPGVRMHHVEATYLAWLDVRGCGFKDAQQRFEDGGVVLSNGVDFGAPGFVRFNFGCRRALMEESLARMKAVFG